MRSIGARLALWYGAAATATLACLFIAGYYLLESRLIHGLDLLNQSEFEQIRAHLGPDYQSLDARVINQRIRETTEFASALFYIDIHRVGSGTIFFSNNLQGRSIPDIKGKRQYDINWDGIGMLRVGEFILPPYDVILGTPENQLADVKEGYIEVCAGLMALMLLLSVAIGFGLSRMALRPVRLIRETAGRIGSDTLSERIPVSAVKDEISDLAALLNAMFDRLESAFKSVRHFAADASHELKTPLSLVRLHAEKILASGGLGHENEEELLALLEEVNRLNATIDELLFLSRAEAGGITLQLAPHDPAPLIANFAADAQVLAEHRGMRFDYRHEGAGRAICEPRWVRRMLLNLLGNAVAASPRGGRIHLSSAVSGGWWRIAVEDEGHGVPAAEREHIFDRFVRLASPAAADAPEHQGSGLGLAICRGIADLHRGRIFAGTGRDGRGLKVVIEIPLETATAPPPRSGGAQPQAAVMLRRIPE